jgi:hypothetical protein
MTQPALIPNVFGSDLACLFTGTGVGDLTPTMQEVTGPPVVAQRLLCRLTTPRGSVLDSPNDCIDIRGYVRASVTPAEVQAMQSQILGEIQKEQCLQTATVSVGEFLLVEAQLQVTITISVTTAKGPFTLTLLTSAVTVTALLNGAPLGTVA